MDKEFYMNAGIPPPLQFDHPFSTSMNAWQSLSSAMEMQTTQSPDCFLSTPPPNDHFESALSSMVSSPAASNSALSSDNFMIRELIGKLGNICNSNDLSQITTPPPYIGGGNCSTNNSCYGTPLSSPPKMGMSMPIVDHSVKDKLTNFGNSMGLSSNLPAMPGDPGFAERAARFSSFGSRSFNGRTNSTSQFASNKNVEVGFNRLCSNLGGGNGKLQRVSSSPLLKAADGYQASQNNNSSMNEMKQSANNSQENSSISGQNQASENGSSRKRKAAISKGKGKDADSHPQTPSISHKLNENGEDSSAKRSKSDEENGNQGSNEKSDVSKGGDDNKMQNQKPPEPPKDYIHVRARRGQATDSHSLAERVRREKIGERMKLLQDLVPGCNKVTGKALMLDEIINYVQSLQRQVEFLSMKLANVNPGLELNTSNLFSKDAIQQNCSLQQPMYPSDTLAPTLYGQPSQNPLQDNLTAAGSTAPCSLDTLNPLFNQNHHNLHLPSFDGFPNCLPQLASLSEGDLQSIVQMGFHAQSFHGSNPTPMKTEF